MSNENCPAYFIAQPWNLQWNLYSTGGAQLVASGWRSVTWPHAPQPGIYPELSGFTIPHRG